MSRSVMPSDSSNIAIRVIPQDDGRYICEIRPSLEGRRRPAKRFHGQTAKHAIAIALENLAGKLRMETEAEQELDWFAVDRTPSGTVSNKRFHVVVHYERVAEEESKSEAMINTMMGNTVVENAEITIVRVDPDLAIKPWRK